MVARDEVFPTGGETLVIDDVIVLLHTAVHLYKLIH